MYAEFIVDTPSGPPPPQSYVSDDMHKGEGRGGLVRGMSALQARIQNVMEGGAESARNFWQPLPHSSMV